LTGRVIVDAILAGQRDGAELAKLRDPHIKADADTIRKSLEGNWRPEHLFTLGQSRDLYRIYQQQIVNCDLEIEKMLRQFESRTDPEETPLPPDRKRNRVGSKRRKKNGHPHPEFDVRTETYKLFGVDVTQIPGIEENALPLFSEVGRDMSRWPSAVHQHGILQAAPFVSRSQPQIRARQCVLPRTGYLEPRRNRAIPRPFLPKTGPFPQDHLRRRFSGNLPRCTGVLTMHLTAYAL